MALLFTLPRSAQVDSVGQLMAGWTVEFYTTLTSTPRTVYSDSALNTPLGSSVQASDDGTLRPIYLDDTGTAYKIVIKDSDGAVVPNGTIDPYLTGPSQAQISIALNPRTNVEIAAGITPISHQYPEGCAFRLMTAAQIADVIAGTLTQDVTSALQSLFNLSDDGVDCYLPPGKYFISDSLTKSSAKNFRLRGCGRRTVIVNKASASKPAIKLTDILYARLEDFVISGRAGFPNLGLLIDATGVGLNGNFELRNLSMEPNGNGIEVRKANTIELSNFEYWPSGGLGVGSSQDAGNRKHGFFVDGSIADNYCNDILMIRPNIIGVDQTISGHALIKIESPTLNGIQGVTILQGELEGLNQKIQITKVANLQIMGGYYDDADIVLDNVRFGAINGAYNADLVSLASCQHVMLENLQQGDAPSSFIIDSGSSMCGADNVDFANAPTNSSTTSVFRNWSIAGVPQNDTIRQRWATPSFAAGDYTATTGTWTVASGDVLNMRYKVSDKEMTLHFDVSTTTTASGCTALHMKIPGGFAGGAAGQWFEYIYSEDNGTTTSRGVGRIIAADTKVTLYKDLAGTAFSNVTDLLAVRGTVTFEIA